MCINNFSIPLIVCNLLSESVRRCCIISGIKRKFFADRWRSRATLSSLYGTLLLFGRYFFFLLFFFLINNSNKLLNIISILVIQITFIYCFPDRKSLYYLLYLLLFSLSQFSNYSQTILKIISFLEYL